MHCPVRILVPLVFLLLAAGCGSTPAADVPQRPALAEPELPPNAAPAPELQPLAFLAGRWVGVNPNQTVNEEHWMAPRGSAMIGTFRQVRLDGKCAFVELSQIALENGEVVLRLRHLHGRLEVPEKRKDVSLFRLQSVGENRVQFAGTGDAEGVSAVIYERTGEDELVQRIEFDPAKSQEKPFTSTYRRVP